MAINVVYQPDAALPASVAHAAGTGQFLQNQSKFGLEQDRLALSEAQLAQQGNQFNRQLSLKAQLALLNDRRQQQQLYQNSYQNQQRIAAQAESNAANRDLSWQQSLLQAEGYDAQRQSAADLQDDRQAFEAKQSLTQSQQRLKEQHTNRLANMGMSAATEFEKQKGQLSPDEQNQWKSQWFKQFGDILGKYPYDGIPSEPEPKFTREGVTNAFRALVGADIPADVMNMLGSDTEDGGFEFIFPPEQFPDFALRYKEQEDRKEKVKADIAKAEAVKIEAE